MDSSAPFWLAAMKQAGILLAAAFPVSAKAEKGNHRMTFLDHVSASLLHLAGPSSGMLALYYFKVADMDVLAHVDEGGHGLGGFLDPMADKITVNTALVLLAVAPPQPSGLLTSGLAFKAADLGRSTLADMDGLAHADEGGHGSGGVPGPGGG